MCPWQAAHREVVYGTAVWSIGDSSHTRDDSSVLLRGEATTLLPPLQSDEHLAAVVRQAMHQASDLAEVVAVEMHLQHVRVQCRVDHDVE